METRERGARADTASADGRRTGPGTGSSTASMPPWAEPASPSLPPVPTLTVVGHPDLRRVGDRAFLGELLSRRPLHLSRRSPSFRAPGAALGSALGDRFLSRQPVILESEAGGKVRVYRGKCRTELMVDGEAVPAERHLSPEEVDRGVVLELAGRVVLLLHRYPARLDEVDDGFAMIGASAALEGVRAAIERLSAFDIPVLLRGETGTGKELVARALHEQGLRRQAPFLDISLAAVPASLAAAELFGVTKGAFTGAHRDRPGYFQRAHGGTLFLDEVGEASVELQVLLLRALETGVVHPSGSSRGEKVDVRVLSATDADLEELSLDGRFRLPLLHRLAGYTLRLPPLRERRDDIGRLLVHFLRRELGHLGSELPDTSDAPIPWLSAALVSRLTRASWPGNVRQLANVARHLVIDGRGHPQAEPKAGLSQLLGETTPGGREIKQERSPKAPPPVPLARPRRRPSQLCEDEILEALRGHRFNLKEAAAALGIPRTSLYSRIQRSDKIRFAAEIPQKLIRESWERCQGDLEAMVMDLEVSARGLRQRLRDLGLEP